LANDPYGNLIIVLVLIDNVEDVTEKLKSNVLVQRSYDLKNSEEL